MLTGAAPRGGFFLLGAVVLTLGVLRAAPTDDHAHFQQLAAHDGLPAAVVNCGLQDSRGFLWFGTGDGLARFDAHEFRVFRPNPTDPASIASGIVVGLQEDARGNLWVATEGGLELWHRDTESFEHFRHHAADPASLSADSVTCVLVDGDVGVWVGTRGGGLGYLNLQTRRFSRVGPAAGTVGALSDEWVRCLARDREGTLWVGTEGAGLNHYDRAAGHFVVHRSNAEDSATVSGDRVSALAVDASGQLWVGTNGGLCRFEARTGRFVRYRMDEPDMNAAPNRTITAIVADAEGKIWLGTDGGGLTRLDPATGRCTYHRRSRYTQNSLVADAVRCVFEDRQGDLWIGHFPAGVSHFDRSAAAFQVFTHVVGESNSLSDDHVLSFWEDLSGDLWVGTDNGGLNVWQAERDRWISYRHDPADEHSLGAKAAVSVYRDSHGALWVGTWEGGLNRFDANSGGFERYLPRAGDPNALSDSHVWSIVEDHQRQLWLGTLGGGVDRFVRDEERFVHHRHDPARDTSINDDIVTALMVSRAGDLWAGTPRGIARLDRSTQAWRRYQTKPGETGTLAEHWVFDLVEDPDGSVWVTTEGGGLNRLDPSSGRADVFRTADGLPSDALRGILRADDGSLWIGSNRGLIRFDPRTRKVRVFDENNGLPSGQFSPHARLRLGTGEFLFGTTQGFIRFDPGAFSAPAPAVPVVLTRMQAFNEDVLPGQTDSPLARSITETQTIEIPARWNVISFEFAALNFRAGGRMQYRVKLEGFDREWRKVGSEHRTTFTNLDAGRYRLRVQAADADGAWGEPGARLEIAVVPPWWRTTSFKITFALLLLAAAAAAGWAIAAQRLRELQRRRELATERERTAERERAAEALRVLNQELDQRVTERNAQLAVALKELEAFSYSVSHDLRAPLRAVDGFSSMLLESHGKVLDEKGHRHITRIRAASEKMSQLIDALLNLSRVSRGEMHRRAVNLSDMAQTIADELQQEHPTQRLEFAIAPDLRANGDPRLLQIALSNLLGNACKFSSKRDVARIEVGMTERDGARTFYVRDNGAGFSMAYAVKLFGAFQRLHSEAEFPGTGIGLATVNRIIQRHGGTLSAEAQVDQGATFYFTLPDGA